MIDTVVLETPFIDELTALKIEDISVTRFGIDYLENKILYKFTTKELKGTYDSSIRININRTRWISRYDLSSRQNIAVKEDCQPFLRIELSLHKFFLGHNIYGGSNDLNYQVKKFIYFLESEFQVELPSYSLYTVRRLDFAKVYNLGENISDFFEGFSNVYYPRRRVRKYDNTGLYFPGSYTTLKLYNKYVEFKKHDKKRLRHFLSPNEIKELENKARGILRVEVEFKSRKLKDMYNELPKVKDINIKDFENHFNVELMRIFKVGKDKMKLYNNSTDVERVLKSKYGTGSNVLIATWYRLTIFGYDKVKNDTAKSTFYRHIKKLRDAGVSWNHTDIIKTDNNVVEFIFNPLNTNLEIDDDLIKIA